MAKIFVTGSADSIGLHTAQTLIAAGHDVTLHARNAQRADDAAQAAPGAAGVLIGDLASLDQTWELGVEAAKADFDVVVHNAGVGGEPERTVTDDGIQRILQVNVLAPYLLTALMPRPRRLVYLTSGLEAGGQVDFDDLQRERRPWSGMAAYSDSKLYDVVLAFAVARLWPDVITNAVDPGWIKTRMGGPGATDELPEGSETQVWLAASDEPAATATGRYLKRRQSLRANPAAYDVTVQDTLLAVCAELTGATLPV